jgi:hypothetical protein
MRIAIAALPLLLLGACQVSKDSANNAVTVEYNADVAENALEDVGNTAENLASDIGNDVERTAEKIDNKVGGDDHSDGNTTNAH